MTVAESLDALSLGRPGGKSYGVRVRLLADLTEWNPICTPGTRAFLYPEQADYLVACGAAVRIVEGDAGEVRPRNTLRWWVRRRLFGRWR